MKNTEEDIERYLANEMGQEERASFEAELAGSPEMQEEVRLQKEMIEGIYQARSKELKQMLESVSLATGPLNTSSAKAALATLSVLLVGSALYYSSHTKSISREPLNTTEETGVPSEPIIAEPEASPEANTEKVLTTPRQPLQVDESVTHSASTENTPPATAGKEAPPPPDITVEDIPLEKTDDTAEEQIVPSSGLPDKTDLELYQSPLEITLKTDDPSYQFHYRFTHEGLCLYGPFVKNIYELIEDKRNGSSLYLHYQNKYYHLNKKQAEISPLAPITDMDLIKKLELSSNL